jgi:hypothetical protein
MWSSCGLARPCFKLGTQLAHLLCELAVVDLQARRLAPRGGHFLCEHGQHAAKAAKAIYQLIALPGL